MERDFLGLNSKKSYETVKEEDCDVSKVVPRSSNSDMQWSFSNKDSASPQFLSFTVHQEDVPREGAHRSSSFMTTSTADAFNSSQKSFSSANQKNFIHEKQAGNRYGMNVYPKQHRGENQAVPISLSTSVLQHIPFRLKSMAGSSIKPQPLAGVPVLTRLSAVPSKSSVVGTTDLRNGSNSSGAPGQLTIFYAGAVNVYHDISPEKAQAIMSLAGHGSSTTTAQGEKTFPCHSTPSTGDGFIGNQSNITSSISGLASPIYVTTHATVFPGGAFGTSNALTVSKPVATSVSKPVATSASSIYQSEASNVVARSFMKNLIRAVPVPQARKASLARFFEKHKERMTSTLPYNLSKKYPDSNASGSNALGFSLNLSSSSPSQAINQAKEKKIQASLNH